MKRHAAETLRALGALRLEVRRRGVLWCVQRVPNLVTLAGRNLIRDLLAREPGAAGLSYFALGTGTTAPSSADTRLAAEVFRDTFTQLTLGTGQLTVRYFLGSGAANGYALAEAGLFGGSASPTPGSGTLYSRVVFLDPIPKTQAITVTFIWVLSWEV